MCNKVHGRGNELELKRLLQTVKDHLVRLDRDIKRSRKDLSKMYGIRENDIKIRKEEGVD